MSSVSRGSTAVICSVVFASLAACLVLARLIARLTILKFAGRDELAITVSLVSRDQTFTLDVLHFSCAWARRLHAWVSFNFLERKSDLLLAFLYCIHGFDLRT